jgi:alkyldihydroxyacetonephosphate synthase
VSERTPAIVGRLRASLGDAVVTDPATLEGRRHDYWVLSHIRDRVGEAAPAPACVVRPRGVGDVQTTVRACVEAGVALIPFGLGSGVVGGVVASTGAVVLDMSAMATVRFIDSTDLLAAFDAGVCGADAEAAVAEHGLTIGHWPQSLAVSTVGGWVATRASGQFSTAYGNIEDMIFSIEAVLANGEVVTLGRGPRASAGPDLRALLMGSEGALGVITGVTLSVRRAAARRAFSVFEAGTMASGIELQRQIVQAGWRPPVMRLYDERESRRLDARASACVLLMIHEGAPEVVEIERAAVGALAQAAGATPAPLDIAEHWLDHRNSVPVWDVFLQRNLVVDTVEVSAPWSAIGAVYESATARLKGLPGLIAGSAHSSHAYRSGLNLYFTFAIQCSAPGEMEPAYLAAWDQIMQATAEHGGSLAHHHGIGRVRRGWLETELGVQGVGMLRAVKQALDPAGVFNPGVLIP